MLILVFAWSIQKLGKIYFTEIEKLGDFEFQIDPKVWIGVILLE